VTAEEWLLLCLGNERSIYFRNVVRVHPGGEPVYQAIHDAMLIKPQRHYFNLAQKVKMLRFMNTTSG